MAHRPTKTQEAKAQDASSSPPSPTHGWVAERIGFSIAGVSLLRSGQRMPSIPAMETIAQAFDWPVAEQIGVRKNYAEHFEAKIKETYQESLDDSSNPVAD